MHMKVKRLIILLLSITQLTGCANTSKIDYSEYQKYSDTMFDSFDTVIQVVAYTKSKEEFDQYFKQIHDRFMELHQLYDIYNNYEGLNNLKTVNDQAGIEPVKVAPEIIDLIVFCKKWYEEAGEGTNIAMGAVLNIWQDYRDEGLADPAQAKLPPIEQLQAAAEYMDMDKVIVDVENSTVFLADLNMSLNEGGRLGICNY